MGRGGGGRGRGRGVVRAAFLYRYLKSYTSYVSGARMHIPFHLHPRTSRRTQCGGTATTDGAGPRSRACRTAHVRFERVGVGGRERATRCHVMRASDLVPVESGVA